MILMILMPSSFKQSFKRKVHIHVQYIGSESSSHLLLFRRENEIMNFRESGWIEI